MNDSIHFILIPIAYIHRLEGVRRALWEISAGIQNVVQCQHVNQKLVYPCFFWVGCLQGRFQRNSSIYWPLIKRFGETSYSFKGFELFL